MDGTTSQTSGLPANAPPIGGLQMSGSQIAGPHFELARVAGSQTSMPLVATPKSASLRPTVPRAGVLSRLLPVGGVGRAVHTSISAPEVSLCVTTYQRPWHLRRALASIAAQLDVDGRFEVVVTDDGSTDETESLVDRFSRDSKFKVKFTTHPHAEFHPAQSRNEGARASAAPYILYLDGDCVLPPDHVAIHLRDRRRNKFMLGESYRIEEEMSQRLTEEGAARGDFLRWSVPDEVRRLRRLHRMNIYNGFIRHRSKPRLISNNFAAWQSDLELINGFDENYRGWGQEDDDIGRRLRHAGVRPRSILGRTRLYHLWHQRDPSMTDSWHEGPNVRYYFRRGWLKRCRNGLVKRPLNDLAVAIVGQTAHAERVVELWRQLQRSGSGFPSIHNLRPAGRRPEVEILFYPGSGQFSGRAECNVLVALDDSPIPARLLDHKLTHRIVVNRKVEGIPAHYQFPLTNFVRAMESIT